MPDKNNNKTKKIGGLDIKKARAIILDAIGDNERQKTGNAKEASVTREPSPLFFQDKKFIKTKKETELSESEKNKNIQEVKRAIEGDEESNKNLPPLSVKEKKNSIPEKENKHEPSGKADIIKHKKIPINAKNGLKSTGRRRRRKERKKEINALKKIKLIPTPRKKFSARVKRARLIASIVIYVFFAAILLFAAFYYLV